MRKLLLIGLIISSSAKLFAQEADVETKTLRLGFRAQPIFSWMHIETRNLKNNGVSVGGKFGILIDKSFGKNKNYAFGTGIDFVMVAGSALTSDSLYKINIEPVGLDTVRLNSRKYKLQYLDIPLTLKLKTNPIGDFVYFVQLGGTIGVNISAKSEDNGYSQLKNAQFTETVKLKTGLGSGSEVKLVRAEVSLGIGAEWSIISNLGLMMGVSYHKGLMNVFNGKNQNIKENVTGKTLNPISQSASLNYVSLNLALLV